MSGRLEDMALFVAVVDRLSLSGAARDLGLSKSLVSRRLGQLEDRLGARLINRTTRRLALTDIGQEFHERARRVIQEAEEAEACAQEASTELRGRLRIAAPVSFGYLHLAAALSAFLAEHPGVEVDIELSDRFVDLVGEGYDLAIRSGLLEDSSLVTRFIAASRIVLAASPGYLARQGRPAAPADLSRHVCLAYGNQPIAASWRFLVDGKWIAPTLHPQLVANNGDVLSRAAIEGLGIVALPDFILGPALARGLLERLLPDLPMPEQPVQAIYPGGRPAPQRLRRFVDFVAAYFARRQDWSAAPDAPPGSVNPLLAKPAQTAKR
jgi:DNA-binding transcriptional LysR family regulator